MKLGIRKTVLGVVAALSLGVALPLAAPASAASCSELLSTAGSTARATTDPRNGSFTIDVKDTLRTSAAGCSTSWKYTLQLVDIDRVARSEVQTAYGTGRSGAVTFPAFRSSLLPSQTTELAFDLTSYTKGSFGWTEQSTRRFVVSVPNLEFDSEARHNAYPVDSCSASTIPSGGSLERIAVGYSPWCK